RLPLAAGQTAGEAERRPPSPSAPASQCEEAALDGLRVLVVDDEPDNNDVVGTLLSSRGAEVRLAGSARQAVEMLREWKPDVLVTDIAMPDQDGYDLLASIRSQEGEPAEILAIALTAYASREDRIRLLSAGFQAHVAKPVDSMELTAVVASLGRTAQRLRAQAGRPAMAHAPAGGGRPVGLAGQGVERRRVLFFAALLMLVTGIGFAGLSAFWPLLLVAVVGTLNPTAGDVSVFLPVEQAVLAETVRGSDRTAVFAWYNVAGTLAGGLGALVSGVPG